MSEDTTAVAEVAETETKPAPKPKPVPANAKTESNEGTSLTVDDAAELERLRKFRTEASKWEKRAKSNFDDAQRYRELVEQLAGTNEKDAGEFDAKAAFQALNAKLESAEKERLRAEVARTENVNPKYITGTTEDEMRAAAQEFRADVEQLVEAARAAEVKTAAAPPASSVTSNGKISGPQQIQSRDQLKKMSSTQIREAMKAGELDQLLGKQP